MTLAPWPVRPGPAAASRWVQRWTPLVPARGHVLDVACGSGRHIHWFVQQGYRVSGVDRDAAAVASLHGSADILVADIENGPWPYASQGFDAVVVTNYLWRPLLPVLIAAVAPGGVLIYETFAAGNESVGKPSNPDFLLQPGELLAAVEPLRVVAFEDGFEDSIKAGPQRFVQRVAAVRVSSQPNRQPTRYPLTGLQQ